MPRCYAAECRQPEESSSDNSSLDSALFKTLDEEMNQEDDAKPSLAMLAVPAAGIVLLLGMGFLLKDQIKARDCELQKLLQGFRYCRRPNHCAIASCPQDFLDFFIAAVDDWGPYGVLAYAVTYGVLEVLAVPAIPLTMTAGRGSFGQGQAPHIIQ